jgi:hypothetical protein
MAFGKLLIGRIVEGDIDKILQSRKTIGIGLSEDDQNKIYEEFLGDKNKIKEGLDDKYTINDKEYTIDNNTMFLIKMENAYRYHR